MANQGGSHDQHVKAGKQSHKSSDTKQAPMARDGASERKGGSRDQSKAGMQARKDKH